MGLAEPPASPGPPPLPSPSLGWRFRLVLVGLILARGVAELCVMPPFEGWDEYQHVGHIVHVLETGRRATLGTTEVPRSLLLAMEPLPQPRTGARADGTAPGVIGI